MSEIKNGRLGLYGAENSECNRMMTLGFKGLSCVGRCDHSLNLVVGLSIRTSGVLNKVLRKVWNLNASGGVLLKTIFCYVLLCVFFYGWARLSEINTMMIK